MSPSLQLGKVRVGPWMLLFSLLPHVLMPGLLLLIAHALDRRLGWSLDWALWVRLPLGACVLAAAIAVEAASLPHFIRVGGTPSPLHHTESLVVTGPYRHCRHPIYAAYLGYILGPGIMLGLMSALLVTAAVCLCFIVFAKTYEEPDLRRRFGEDYERYRRRTPFMIPRLRP